MNTHTDNPPTAPTPAASGSTASTTAGSTTATAPAATTAPGSGLPLRTGVWRLDKGHARVGFAVRHLGLAKVRGHFTEVDAELIVGDSLADTTVVATISTASIDTASAARDASVRSPAVLDVERRPTIAFRSTGIRPTDDGWTLDGELTIGDAARPISLEVELAGVAEVYGGGRHAGFDARGELRRKDFGLSFGPADPAVGQVIALELDLEFVEPT